MIWSRENLPEVVKKKNWSENQIDAFIEQANSTLEKISSMAVENAIDEEKINAMGFPKFYMAKHMQTGLAKYENETILVDNDAIKRMIPSMKGKPIYVHHQDVNLDSLKEDAAGFVTKSFFNELDGWAWLEFMVLEDDAIQAISNGWSVSNAYIPTEYGDAGTLHNCDYDRQILNGTFTHLAIVPNPRYENACIMTPDEFRIYQDTKRAQLEEVRNAKQESMPMFKWFKNTKEEIKNSDEITDDSFTEINGKKVTLAELKALENAKKNEDDKPDDKDKDKEKENEMFDIDGEEVTLESMKNAYRKMNKKNSDDEEPKKEKENESDADEEEKKNALKHFEELRNAPNKARVGRIVETSSDKLARGKSRYGSGQ